MEQIALTHRSRACLRRSAASEEGGWRQTPAHHHHQHHHHHHHLISKIRHENHMNGRWMDVPAGRHGRCHDEMMTRTTTLMMMMLMLMMPMISSPRWIKSTSLPPPPSMLNLYIYIYQEHNGSDLSMSMVMMPMHARSDIGWGCLLDGWMDGWGMMVLTRAPPLEEHADGGGATWHVIGASWVIMNRKEQNTSLPRPSTELRWLLAPGRWPSPSSSRMGSSRMFPLSRKNQDNLISKTKQKHAIFQDN